MPRLDDSIEALTASPEEFGLQLVYPAPRTDWCQLPVVVEEVKFGGRGVELRYQREGLPSGQSLVPEDLIWHQPSNMIALVVARIDHRRVTAIGLVAPDTEEELDALRQGNPGSGIWMVVGMGWLPEWSLPSELLNLPELVDLSNPQSLDLFSPEAQDRRGWVAEGKINPNGPPMTQKRRNFLNRQQQAFAEMVQAVESGEFSEEELTTELPKPGELEKGEAVETIIPMELPKPKGRILSYKDQKKRTKTGDD